MKVSVVIITYNRSDSIKHCLDSMERQTVRPGEIIVVDSSTDMETEKLTRERDVIYKHLRDRTYQPRARNIAVEMSQGDIIAFLDDDTVCVPGWLENIIQGYSFDNIVGVGGPAIICDENLNPLAKIKSTDRNQNFFTKYGDMHLVCHWIPSQPVRTEIFIGANMSFLKEALKEVGGFDEFYGRSAAYREETDPQIALIKRGYNFLYMPGAFVYHLHHKTGGASSDDQGDYFYWCAKNHKYLADKYFPKWLSRLSWIFWSFDPPCLWLCLLSAIYHRKLDMLQWAKGLWL